MQNGDIDLYFNWLTYEMPDETGSFYEKRNNGDSIGWQEWKLAVSIQNLAKLFTRS